MELDGKAAIVTGGGRGGGAAIARALASAGFRVLVNYHSSKDAAERLATEIGGAAIGSDVSTDDDARAIVAACVDRWGGVDVLVNNASFQAAEAWDKPLDEVPLETFERVYEVDLRGTFLMCRAALPSLRERQGCIVNIASAAALLGDKETLAYNAAKLGVVGLTKSLARSEAGNGVRVNAVAPGSIDTGWIERWGLTGEEQDDLIRAIPLRRVGTGADLAAAVTFLCSPDASYITGQVLVVDGGVVMH